MGRGARKPKAKMSQEVKILTELPNDDETELVTPARYSNEDFKIIKNKFESSNRTLGFQPLTAPMVESRIKKLEGENIFIKNISHQQKFNTATISLVHSFLKDIMLIPQPLRDQIQISKVFNSPKANWNIIYAEFTTKEDVSVVTSHAKFMAESQPGQPKYKMLDYIPKEFQARFNGLEKLTCDIRRQSNGTIQTNLRKSSTDFILRTRDKCIDPAPWNSITATIIPNSIPRFEVSNTKPTVLATQPHDKVLVSKVAIEDNADDIKLREDKLSKEKTERDLHKKAQQQESELLKIKRKKDKKYKKLNGNVLDNHNGSKKSIIIDNTINDDIRDNINTSSGDSDDEDDIVPLDDSNYNDNEDEYDTPDTSELSEASKLARTEIRAEIQSIEDFHAKCLNTSTRLPVVLALDLEKALNNKRALELPDTDLTTPKRPLQSPELTDRPVKAPKASKRLLPSTELGPVIPEFPEANISNKLNQTNSSNKEESQESFSIV